MKYGLFERRQSPEASVPYLEYRRQRLAGDPRLWASTMFVEVTGLGYEGGYSTFTLLFAGIRPGRPASRVTRRRAATSR